MWRGMVEFFGLSVGVGVSLFEYMLYVFWWLQDSYVFIGVRSHDIEKIFNFFQLRTHILRKDIG